MAQEKFINISSNVSGSVYLNNGLPWTNPLKITIGSDEHILDTTINRGLMMLLNNDYYLDMKTTLMSQELSAVIDNTEYLNQTMRDHINNTGIHGARGTTIVNNSYTTIVSGRNQSRRCCN